MKHSFTFRILLFLSAFIITIHLDGQSLPDPGNDPLHAVDSVIQNVNTKSNHSNLLVVKNDSLAKRTLPQMNMDLPFVTADKPEKRKSDPY